MPAMWLGPAQSFAGVEGVAPQGQLGCQQEAAATDLQVSDQAIGVPPQLSFSPVQAVTGDPNLVRSVHLGPSALSIFLHLFYPRSS